MTVDIQEGPVASYFYPRKGKPPLLKPGEEYCKPMPMVFFNKLPASFSIIVSEM